MAIYELQVKKGPTIKTSRTHFKNFSELYDIFLEIDQYESNLLCVD